MKTTSPLDEVSSSMGVDSFGTTEPSSYASFAADGVTLQFASMFKMASNNLHINTIVNEDKGVPQSEISGQYWCLKWEGGEI